MTHRPRILVLDDDAGVRRTLRTFLEGKGYEIVEAGSLSEAVEVITRFGPDVAVLDYMLPDGTALELMSRLVDLDPDLPVVILTGHGTIELAVRAIKEGAEHFLTKPVELAALAVVVERMLSGRQSRQLKAASERRVRTRRDPFMGDSRAIRSLRENAEKLAASHSPVLILGETGIGKGVLARWLHENGPRHSAPMVDMNCSSLSRELLESELFGHEKGAFTGAVSAKKGLLEVAHRGTLFLDEIADLEESVQPKLLTVLEEMRFRRLGETRDRLVNIRLIAATHQDMQLLVQEKKFRADLYFRIGGLPLRIPPLRERREDIPLLAHHLLNGLVIECGGSEARLSDGAVERLADYPWPGNIRELRNALERALLLSGHTELEAGDFHFDQGLLTVALPAVHDSLKDMERAHIERVLGEVDGRIAAAANRLGISRSTLYQKIKTYDI